MVARTKTTVPKKTRVRISKSGQVTLPAKIRKQLGVDIGEQVDFVQQKDGTIQLRPVESLAIEEFAGSLGPPPDGQTLTDYLTDIDRLPMVRSIYERDRKQNDSD